MEETEVEDCRSSPWFDCGVCPDLGTEIQVKLTGRTLLPFTPVRSRCRFVQRPAGKT